MAIRYEQTTDTEIHERVRAKHRLMITELKRLGFQEFSFFGETIEAFGFSPLGLAGFLGTVVALFKEVSKIENNLSVSIFNLLLANRTYATYACPFGLGVKFYSMFSDGTCIVSANFESAPIQDEKERLYKFAASRTVEATWKDHQQWVATLRQQGKQENEPLSFTGYLKTVQQEDSYMLKNKNTTLAGDLFSTISSAILSVSLLLGITYFFLFFMGFVQILFPSCLVVSDQSSMLGRILLAFGGIAISWILARAQTKMLTVNGAGTKLFGRSPSPHSQGYIATKWLTLIIPLLPVRSYEVAGEYTNQPDQTQYVMKPLEKMDWAQIKETIWRWKLGYAVFVVILAILSLLTVWKCI